MPHRLSILGRKERDWAMNNLLSSEIRKIPRSGIRKIYEMSQGMEDVVHLEIGEPDFPTPPEILERAFEAARDGETHYTPNAGTYELREAISKAMTTQIGIPYTPDEIVVTAGASEALMLASLVTLSPNDEVIVPSPHYPNYVPQILISKAVPKEVVLNKKYGFNLTPELLENSITTRTKAVLLNYPHNPTGAMLDTDTLRGIAECIISHNLIVYSDEAYEAIVYHKDGHTSIASIESLKERTIIVRSFSKSYAMTGWRIGFLAAPRVIAEHAAYLHENTSICASSISQKAALAALQSCKGAVQYMREAYKRRRDIVIEEATRLKGVELFEPRGTFFAFLDISGFGLPSRQLAQLLLLTGKVAVVPGDAFGPGGEGFIRVSFAASEDTIREGFKRMRKVFGSLG